MSWGEAILLAVVQGLTEFLPISSSGHLAALQNYLTGFRGADLAYDVLLHIGTLVSILAYFRRDLWGMARGLVGSDPRAAASRRLMWMVGAGTVPTGIVYLLFGEWIEASFGSLVAIGVAFLATGTILFTSRLARGQGRPEPLMRWGDALAVGAAQGVALLPGVSRSGSTIAASLLLGLDRELAVRYSFLLSIPAILAAAVVEGRHLDAAGAPLEIYLTGAAVAAVVGYASIHALLRVVRAGRLSAFALYCWAVGAGILIQQMAAR